MGGEQTQYRINELERLGILQVNDGYRAKNSELAKSGIPFARAGNIDNGFHFEGADRVPPETLQRVGHKRSRPGDVVFTSKGTVGRFALVSESTPEFVYAPQLCFWRSIDPNRIHARWLYYWMSGPDFYRQYKGVAGQTDMAEYVSLRDQRTMRIDVPPIAEQKRIAHILGTLDDKIELNRRMNATLEAIARALFQSWFVNFDPVRAKAAGQTSAGMDPATAALFPSEFEDSALGKIPKGWEVKTLADVIEIRSGGTPTRNKPQYWNGDIPWFSVKDAPANGDVWVIDTEEHATAEGIDRSAANVLPLGTTIISARGTVGKLALTGVPMAMNQSCYGLVATSACPPYYKHFLTQQVVERLQQISHGGVFDTITKQTFAAVNVVVPPTTVVAAFEDEVTPLLERQHANVRHSRTLAALRDALLPKLLSGELRVDEPSTRDN